MGTLKCNKRVLLFLVPALALYCVFFIYPFLQTAIYSFTDWDGFAAPSWIGIDNFRTILKDEVFKDSIFRIFIWAVLSIVIKVGMALVIAYVLTNAIRGIRFFRSVVFLPYIISASAMCLMFTIMYDKDMGLVNMLLRVLGLGNYTNYWLSDPNTAFYAVILIPIYQAVGYFFVILFAAMKDIPEDLYEAGKMDGTNSFTQFILITLPTIWPTLVVCIILAINGAFQNFDYIFIMTYGGPGHASEVPATYMYKSIFVNGEYGYGSAAALLLFILTMAVTSGVRKGLNSRFKTE